MDKVVVSDTNIFIDLVKLDLLSDFFSLPWEFHTTDFVISELEDPGQKASVMAYIKQNKLIIGTFSAEEIGAIADRSDQTGGKISFTDFSVCHYAKKYGFTLLTGDKNLRKAATADAIPVHGILYLFDMLIAYAILPPPLAVEALIRLKEIHSHLPLDEIDARIKTWEQTSE